MSLCCLIDVKKNRIRILIESLLVFKLQLLGCLFSPEELVNGNPSGITNSKDEMRQKSIKKLDPLRITYIYGMLVVIIGWYH